MPEIENRLLNCESNINSVEKNKADLETTNKALMYKADAIIIEEQLNAKADICLLEKKANIKDMTKLLDKKTSLKFFEQTVSVMIEELKSKASESTLEYA